MSAYEKQQRDDYDRYVTLCDKYSLRPMAFVLFQLGYQKSGVSA